MGRKDTLNADTVTVRYPAYYEIIQDCSIRGMAEKRLLSSTELLAEESSNKL